MTDQKVIWAIVIMAAVTALLRFLPFLLLRGKKTPGWVTYFGNCLPYAVMGMLVVYCLKDMHFGSAGGFVPQLLASALVVATYLWKRNTLLSILLGTIGYMILVQAVFV